MSEVSPDHDLVRQMAAGNQRAFDSFFKEYFPRVYRFVQVRSDGDPQAAEDICQMVMTKAMRRIDSYRGEAALFSWLCQIARNEISDYWRRNGKEIAATVRIDDDQEVRSVLESLEAPPSGEPEQEHMTSDVAQLVQVAMDYLPPNYARALELKYLDELTVEEIAAKLDVTVIATQSVLARARAAFRDAFETLSRAAFPDSWESWRLK
ncbi:MAG: RNA polymerase sigma factor [Steroidobacteraceae bacterium]